MGKLIRDDYWFKDLIPKDEICLITPGSNFHIELLEAKLLEEFSELKETNFEDIEEYADVLEVIESLAELKGISLEDIRQEVFEKRMEKEIGRAHV